MRQFSAVAVELSRRDARERRLRRDASGAAAGPERRLFPGVLIAVLAIAGLLRRERVTDRPRVPSGVAVARSRCRWACGTAATGFFSITCRSSGAFARSRASASSSSSSSRCSARTATPRSLSRARPLARRLVLAVAVAVLLLEYRVQAAATLAPYPNEPPPLYAWLARQPPGVVAEFPMPRAENWPGSEPRISYLSTFHWKPVVNGYSGFMPQSYADRLAAMREFPDARFGRTAAAGPCPVRGHPRCGVSRG